MTLTALPAVRRRRLAPRLLRVAGAPVACCLLVATALIGFYDRGVANYDLAYALSWGAELASGRAPSYGVPFPPTPHPLTNLLGVVLSPLGAGATGAAMLLGALAFGALAALAYQLGRELAGPVAGVVAALLVATRNPLLFWGSLTYLDVPYCALLLGAILLEIRRPPRPRGVLSLLLVAGLLRPEAWLLSGAYVGLLWYRDRRLPSLDLLALAGAAPLLWLGTDFATTGKPLYSFTLTRDMTQTFGRASGPGAIPFDLPETVVRVARPAVIVGAILGFALALRERRGVAVRVLGLAVAATAATAVVIAGGTPLNERYVFLAPVVACVLCGAAVAPLASRGPALGRAAGAVVALALVGTLVADLHRIGDGRTTIRDQRLALAELHSVADRAARSRCGRIVAPSRAAPWLSVWRGAPAPAFLARGRTMPAAAVIAPTIDPTVQGLVRANADRLPAGSWRSVRPAWTGRYWTLRLSCG
jgi:hypothetical protein